MSDEVLLCLLMVARAYQHPRYKPFTVSEALDFIQTMVPTSGMTDSVDTWLSGMFRPHRASFIKTREFPHRRGIDMAKVNLVRRGLDRFCLVVASSDHSGHANWWRNPKTDDCYLQAFLALVLSVPEGGVPDSRCTAVIHGICDAHSTAVHGEPYHTCIPKTPLRFVFDMAHLLGWCKRCDQGI